MYAEAIEVNWCESNLLGININKHDTRLIKSVAIVQLGYSTQCQALAFPKIDHTKHGSNTDTFVVKQYLS